MRSFGRRVLAGFLAAILALGIFCGQMAELRAGIYGSDLTSGAEAAFTEKAASEDCSGTSPKNQNDSAGEEPESLRDGSGISLENAKDSSEEASEGLKDGFEGRTESVQNVSEGRTESVQNDAEGKPESVQNVSEGRTESVQNDVEGKPESGQNGFGEQPESRQNGSGEQPESGRNGLEETAESMQDASEKVSENAVQPLNETTPLTKTEKDGICRELAELCREQEAREALFFEEPVETIDAETFVRKLAGQGNEALAGAGNVTWIRTAGYDTTVGPGGIASYNGWGTHAFLVKDSEGGDNKTYPAICMSPNLDAPADGVTYTTATADIFTNEDPTLLKVLYYGFGGSGKDWAEQVYFDNHGVRSKAASLIVTHTAVSKVFRDLFPNRYAETGSQWDHCLAGTTYVKDTEDFFNKLNTISDPPAGSYAQILWVGGRTQFLVYLKRGPVTGRLSVHKYTGNQQLYNDGDYDLTAVFEVYNAATNEKVKTIKTDKNGNSKAVTLPAGTYYLKEVQAGKNMILPQFHYDSSANITILNADVTVEAENKPYGHCRVAIEKVTEFGKTLTDASGVRFTLSIWNGSRYVEQEQLSYDSTLKRFCSGVIYANSANPTGKFKIEETRFPTDYDYLPEGQTPFLAYGSVAEARWSQTAKKEKGKTWGYLWLKTVENRHEYTVQLQKIDKKTGRPVTGAEFVLYAVVKDTGRLQRLGVMKYDAAASAGGQPGLYVYGKDARAPGELPVLITEKNGGAFRVVETVTPENYSGKYEKDFTLTVKTPVDRPYLINPNDAAKNTPDPPYGLITVTKKDPAGRPLTGAKFLVREYDSEKREYTKSALQYYTPKTGGGFEAHTAGTYYLTDNGDGTYTSDYLPILAGDNAATVYGRRNDGCYKVMEISSPEGYVNTLHPNSANVSQRWFQEVRFDTSLPANAVDRRSARFEAVNPENNVPFKKVAADGETPLKAEFTILPKNRGNYGKAFAVRADGEETTLHLSGDGTAAWTGDDGKLTFVRLPSGRYEVRETDVSSPWYEPLEEVFTFTVSDDGSVDGKVTADETLVRNEPGRVLEIMKTDTNPDEGDVETDFPEGTVFHVYSSVNGGDRYRTVPYAKIVYRDGAFVSEKTGRPVKLRWKKSNRGKFKVEEVAATPGYIRDPQPQFVEIPEVPEEGAESTIRLSFSNEPNQIAIRKEDEEGTRLSGAVFTLSRKDDGTQGSADVRTLVTEENGEATALRLRPGVWIYEETVAPEGFYLDPAAKGEFVIDEDGKPETEESVFTVVNYPEEEIVLRKKDAATGAEIDPESGFPSGTSFEVYEWDAELDDYKSSPVMKIVYKEDYLAGRRSGRNAQGLEAEAEGSAEGVGASGDFGANAGLDASRESVRNASFEATGGSDANIGFEATGDSDTHAGFETSGFAAPEGGQAVSEEEAEAFEPAADRATFAGEGTYTVRYDLRGGAFAASATAPPTTVAVGEAFFVHVPRQAGKVFMGWKIDGMTEGQTHYYGQYENTYWNWSNKTTADGISQTGATAFKKLAEAGGQVTFSARWAEPKLYHVTYNLNGGSWNGLYPVQTEAYNGFGREGSAYSGVLYARGELALTPPDGYVFDGWKITGLTNTTHSKFHQGEEWSGAADVERTGAQKYSNLNHEGGTVTFTALWKPMGYDITYDYQGGNGNEANPASASLGEVFEVTPPTREGYDFAGWDITDMTRDASWTWWDAKGQATSGTGVRSLSKIMGVAFKNLRANGDYEVRFKANWSRYAVTYRLQGGSWPDGVSAPTAYTASSALPVPIPIRAGYLFAGWEEFGTSDAVLGNGQTGDVTLTALWLPEGIWVNAKDGGVPVVAKSKKNLGKFKVVEKTATQGYIRDKNPQYFEIDGMETEEHRVELTFENTPNEYRVHKMDPDGLRINGAVFRFYCDDADVLAPHIIGEHTTGPYDGEDGVIVLRRIPTGTWHFKEVSAPSPYIANTTAEYTFAVNSDGEVESARKYQDVPNGSGPSVYIRKVSEEGKPLNGAWFEITRESDGYVLQKKTNSSGTILLAGLSDGSYAVKESQTRNDSLKALGFVLSDETWRIQVQGNRLTALSAGVTIETAGSAKIAVITAVNRRPRLTVLKKDKSGNPLAGARFLLTNLSTGERKSGITGSDGILIFKEAFSEGAWTAVETKAPDGPLAYRLDGHTETFTVENGLFGGMFEELQLAFVNEPYSFEIRKADTKGQPIAGARFHIWSDNGFDQEVETALAENPDQSPMFDESGLRVANALVENLPTGKFYVEEIWTPDGYRLDPQRQEVLVTSDGPSPASLAFVNEPCEVKLRKVDEEGNPLAGATFALKRPETGETVREEVTGEDGYIVLSLPGLSRGTYELWETAAPEGFELLSFGIPLSYDGKNLTVDTTGLEGALFDENSWTVTVEEPRQQAGIVRVRKTDGVTGETLRDAVFEARERIGTDSENGNLYAEAGQELVFLAEEDCFAADPPLPITKDNGGCYKIVEVRAPEGYLRDFEEEIVLEKGEKAAEVMLNAPNTPNSFEIWKEDELGNKLEEAWFKVWREGGQTEAETEALQTTGGILRLEKIASGTWHFREVPPYPAGCKGDDSLHTFIVDEDGRIAGEDHIVVINQWIASEYGGIEINKTNENGEPLEGVVFRAYPFDKEAGANGAFPEAVWLMEHKEETGFTEEETAAFLANAGAYEFAWDAEKKVYRTIQLLPLTEKNQSRYLVVEEGFESPEGYAANARADICLDPEVNPEVSAAEFPTLKLRLLKAEETFVNEPNGVRILKVDEEGDPLPGAVFRVTCDQGHEVFPETDLTTGGDGWTQKLQKLPAGKYSVKEIAAPAGYILHTELTWHFEVNTRGLLAKTLEDGSVIDQDGDGETLDEYSEELEIQAVDEENAVYVLKTDADGEPLADVEVTFWNPNGQLYAVKTTGPDGKTEPLSGLAEGVWTYKETKKNGQPYTDIERHFIVSPLGVREKYGDTPMIVMELRIRNGERTGNVTVEKVDKKTRERLHGAVFEVFPYDPEQSDYDMENPCLTLTEEIGEDGKPTGIYRNEELIVADSENGGMFLVAEMAGPLDPETGERVYAAVWEREIDLYEEPEPAFTVGSGDPAENVKTSYRIEKVDAEENLLDGAVFRIWAEEDEANAYERTTGADGETGAILLGGLDPSGTSPLLSGKTYYYKEITPPPGAYLLDGKVRSFKVAEDGTILGASSGRVKVVNRTQNTTRLSAGGDGRLPGILAACLGFSMLALSAALKAWADARDRQ